MMSRMPRIRFLPFVVVLLLVLGVKIVQEGYRHFAFRDERAEIMRLESLIEEEGLGVVETQIRSDSLRAKIERADSGLSLLRAELDGFERQILAGPVTPDFEERYRGALDRYNQGVEARNNLFQELRRTIDANHHHVDAYNAISDSIRSLAEGIGDPYYPVRSPAEIAAGRGRPARVP